MRQAVRILLAEDNPGDVFLVKQALKRHSIEHELTIAKDGQQAWKLIEASEQPAAGTFDIVMLDLNLPVRPGSELLARIRTSSGELSRVLVVILTSSNSPHDRNAALRDGADYYFCKPSDYEAFLQLGAITKELWDTRDGKTQSHSSNFAKRGRKP